MRWLQWGMIDLEHGFGGVEVHARSVARELNKMGIDARFSMRPEDLLSNDWDVIHTHGSSLPISLALRTKSRKQDRPIRIHALHGETLGRMAACGEWTWPGGYLAAAREYAAVLQADVVVSDHDRLSIYRTAKSLGKLCAVLSNGWDSVAEPAEPLSAQLEDALRALPTFWLFLGRGGDPVKGAARIIAALDRVPEARLVAVPGQGFEQASNVIKTGVLSPGQLSSILARATGLVLPSLYEGLPLVVMEALANGTPVVATHVGGLRTLPATLNGLIFAKDSSVPEITEALRKGQSEFGNSQARAKREIFSIENRKLLPTWETVAERAIRAVEEFRARL